MSFNYWFSKRLRLGKGAAASTTTGTVIAVAGIALALIVMELSIAVASGFKHRIERKVMGFDSAITVLPPYDYQSGTVGAEMSPNDNLTKAVMEILPEARTTETLRRPAIMKTDSNFIAVECVAYGPGHDWSFEQGNIIEGTIGSDLKEGEVVISETMASQLGLNIGDRPYLYFFIDGTPKARRAGVSGIYNSNFGDYDRTVMYTSLKFLQNLGNDSTSISALTVEGMNFKDIDDIVEQSGRLQSHLIEQYRTGKLSEVHAVTNVAERGAIFFSWLGLLDTNVVVIFILMLSVAAFTLISSLFIIILDRVSTIGIIRALGASKREVSRIFLNVAMRIVCIGMAIGNAVALGIIFIQDKTHFLPLNPEMYYLDSVPFEITWPTIVLLNAGVLAGVWLILLLPSYLASRIDPAQTMRYE